MITVDGISLGYQRMHVAAEGEIPISFVHSNIWHVTPGTHTVSAIWGNNSASCTFTAWSGE